MQTQIKNFIKEISFDKSFFIIFLLIGFEFISWSALIIPNNLIIPKQDYTLIDGFVLLIGGIISLYISIKIYKKN